MPTSPARNKTGAENATRLRAGSARDSHGGFTLLEMALTLLIIGLIAALGLPFSRPGGGATALKIKSSEIVAFLRLERNLAIRSGQTVTVIFSKEKRLLIPTGHAEKVEIPPTMTVDFLPSGSSGFQFHADGGSSGGRLLLGQKKLTYVIDVNSQTSAVDLASE